MREIKALAKAELMIAWIEAQQPIPNGIVLHNCEKIIDSDKYVERAIWTLRHSLPLSKVFVSAYMNLYHLKVYLQR